MTDIVSTSQQINKSLAFASQPAAVQEFAHYATTSAPTSAHLVRNAVAVRQASSSRASNDPDLEAKVKKACERVSENLHICANEPSLALYRLAEHVRKALPPTVESRQEVRRLGSQLKGAYANAEDELYQVRQMDAASRTLNDTQDILNNIIFLQQQINYEQQKRCPREQSMYQRLSAHISSVELPDFTELKETARETATKVENALSRNPSSSSYSSAVSDKKVPEGVVGIPRADSVISAPGNVGLESENVNHCGSSKTIISRSQSVSTASHSTQKK